MNFIDPSTVYWAPSPNTFLQCLACTQKGSQCLRKASDGILFCWQHAQLFARHYPGAAMGRHLLGPVEIEQPKQNTFQMIPPGFYYVPAMVPFNVYDFGPSRAA